MSDDQQHHAVLRKCVRSLREMGYRYEEIPDHLESPHRARLEPWEVYEYANPDKSGAQVAAWRRKHHPYPNLGTGPTAAASGLTPQRRVS
jgi:hypothetical protein